MVFEPPQGHIVDGRLHLDAERDWEQLLSRGLVRLAIPAQIAVGEGVRFCEEFHRPRQGDDADLYRGFRERSLEGSVLGYSDAGNDQCERVQLELKLWGDYLPPAVTQMLHAINDAGRAIIRTVFDRCGVDPADIATITGGMERNDALQYGIFNNFESKKQGLDGFTPHKDSGFIQLMYVHEEGFEAEHDGRWVPVPPSKSHFVAILGHSMEVLTAKLPVRATASYHRVASTVRRPGAKDRTSFGIYVGPRFEQYLYQYDEQRKLRAYMSFEAFQRQKAREMGYDFHPALEAKAAS